MPSIYRNGIQFSTNCILESASITAGIIVPYAGDTAPTGWLLCDGSAVSRTTYSVLFDAIGTTYGSGDGSTTFNVPDLRGRVVVGEGTGTATDATAHALGQKSGTETHQLTVNEMPNHGHTCKILYPFSAGGTAPRIPYSNSNNIYAQWEEPINRTGGDQPHNNMQPYTVLNYIISIGSQNGGFTHLKYDQQSGTYNGGIEDEYLLTDDTITEIESWLNI